MGEPADYIRDGAEIYRNSFAIIRAEADLQRFSGRAEKVAVRIIHASGMVEIAQRHRAIARLCRRGGGGAAQRRADPVRRADGGARRDAQPPAGRQRGCLHARATLPFPSSRCRSARRARRRRSSCGGRTSKAPSSPSATRPTALFHLLDMIARGAPRPAAIVGVPVGFVGAAESKEALAASGLVPFLIVRGRKGGSAIAAAAINALASDVE